MSLEQAPLAYCASSTIENQALVYIQNVLPLNTKEYTITYQNYRDNANSTYTTNILQCVTYNLKNAQNVLTVDCVFSDGVPCALEMRIQSGTLMVDSSDSNLISITKSMVKEHAILSNTNLSELLNLLDMLNPQNNQYNVSTKDSTLTLSHFKIPRGIQTVNGQPHVISGPAIDATVFTWKSNNDFADPSAIPLFVVTFQDGVFYSLHDNRHSVSVSQNSIDANRTQSASIAPVKDNGSSGFAVAENVIAVVAVVLLVFVSLLLFGRHRKTANLKQ